MMDIRYRTIGVWLALFSAVCVVCCPTASAIEARKPSHEAKSRSAVVLITMWKSGEKSGERHECFGTLLSPDTVLTAAHCIKDFVRWHVLALYAKNGPVWAAAKSARSHPKYIPRTGENDLAVLSLEGKIAIAGDFPTLYSGRLLPIGSGLIVVGRVDNAMRSESKLFEARTAVAEFPASLNVYRAITTVSEEGDSGGPVFSLDKEKEIVAVVSGGTRLTRANVDHRLLLTHQQPKPSVDPGTSLA